MRTTLAIDDDVLAAAKELAVMQGQTLGGVISSLARGALAPATVYGAGYEMTRNGIPLLPVKPGVQRVTSDLVRQLSEELL